MTNNKVVLITGASSGIGLAAAKRFAKDGASVYCGARRDFSVEGAVTQKLDVCDPSSVAAAIAAVLEREGRIDILINCAGTGIAGAVEYTPADAYRRQTEVNYFGTVEMCRQIIPVMRAQGGGRIINVGSVAYDFAIPFQAFYAASKAAINSFSGALRNEVRDMNIKVACIHPGDARTGFTGSRVKYLPQDSAYNGMDERSIAAMEKDEQNGMTAEACGEAVFRLAMKKNPKPISVIGELYKVFCGLKRLLPARLESWLLYQMYCPKAK